MEGSLSGMVGIVETFVRSCAPFFLTSGALLLGFLVYFYEPYWRVRRVPGPPSTFPVGHLPFLAKHGPDILRVFAKNYGPIFRFNMGRQPLVIVADAELCREVGIKNFKDIKNRSSPSPATGSPLLQKGLFLVRDSRWTSTRNIITSLYQPGHLSRLIPTMQHYIDSFSHNISAILEKEEDIPFSELSLRLAIDVIGKTAFGIEFGLLNEADDCNNNSGGDGGDGGDASNFLKQHTYSIASLKMDLTSSFSTVLGLIAPVLQKPCLEVFKRIPGTADYKLHQTNQKICDRIDAIIAKRSSSETTRESKDFLAALLNARETGRTAKDLLTDSYVRSLTYEHLIAGTKTTAFTLSMTVYLVSEHPEVERNLLQEIDGFGPRDLIPTYDDIQCKFPYLDQVIKESMRMYTVSPLVARETSQPVEIGGYLLPKGTWVWLALGVVAKDPEQFPAPDVFRPERFDPACEEEKRRHPYAHIPFGIGPRACIGQKFAIQELKLSLIHLYRRYVFRRSPKMELPPEFEYSLVLGLKRDIKLRAIKRNAQN